jgi:prevent-host-death family protein
MTATEASRSFAALLDAVERGESFVITRGGRRIASLGPAPLANGAALRSLLEAGPDPDFAADVESALRLIDVDAVEWPAD